MAKGDFSRKMDEWQRKAALWARGRNGADDLAFACSNLGVACVIVNLFFNSVWLGVAALALLGYSWFRICSKQLSRRAQENAAAIKASRGAVSWLAHPVSAAREAKAYKHFSCPSCGQRVRVPRGKGKVRVTCPSCRAHFEGKA